MAGIEVRDTITPKLQKIARRLADNRSIEAAVMRRLAISQSRALPSLALKRVNWPPKDSPVHAFLRERREFMDALTSDSRKSLKARGFRQPRTPSPDEHAQIEKAIRAEIDSIIKDP
jgi:hypothetical protein